MIAFLFILKIKNYRLMDIRGRIHQIKGMEKDRITKKSAMRSFLLVLITYK